MKSVLQRILGKAGPFIGLALVVGLFALLPGSREHFLTLRNLRIILTQTVIVSIGSLGMTLIIVSGAIDLSVGSTIALTGVIGALLIRLGWGASATTAGAIGVGALIGFLNGSAVAGLRMPSFIITLGMLGVARGTAKWLANNETVNYDSSPIDRWMTAASPSGFALPAGVWVAVALAAATALLLKRTVFGRHVFALGSNEAAARLCGVPTTRLKILVFTLAGCTFGLAGIFQLARLRVGDPTVAVGLELDIIAAVIIGGASLSGGSGTVLGSIIGALIMSVLRNGSQQMGWQNYFQEIIIGLVIIVAVFLDRFRRGGKA
jgi:ribose transport system permease protein